MTLENVHFPASRLKNTKGSNNVNLSLTNSTTDLTKVIPKRNLKDDDFKFSDIDSNFTSISQVEKTSFGLNNSHNKSRNIYTHNESTENSKSVFTNVKEGLYQSYNGENSTLSFSIKEYESDESFLTIANREKHKYEFINPKEDLLGYPKPLRLFNKNGKPLTDRVGRSLIDILGQPLVVFDDKGRFFSDSKGNQVFNCLGESAIYSSTNLHVSPSEDEAGIPILDIDKRHILFLYDSKGYPLTDSLGRPLTSASGSLMFGMKPNENINFKKYKDNQLKNIYGKAPLENFVRRVQIFNSNLKALTDENGSLLRSARIICNKNGMPMCDENGSPLFFKYGARIITPQPRNMNDEKSQESEKNTDKTPTQLSEDSLAKVNFESEVKSHIEDHKESIPTQKNITYGGVKCKVESSSLLNNDFKNITLGCEKKLKNVTDNSKPFTKKSKINRNKLIKISENSSSSKDSIVNDDKTFDQITERVCNSRNENFKHQQNTGRNSVLLGSTSQNVFKNIIRSSSQDSKKILFQDATPKYERDSAEAIVLFDASKKMGNQQSTMNTIVLKNNKEKLISHSIVKRKGSKKMYTSNFIEYIKNALNLTNLKENKNKPVYNEYGKPMRDIYDNLLYDKFGIPLTGTHGKTLDEKARHSLRIKLRHIPVLPVNKEKLADGNMMVRALTCNESHDQFGDPLYDKHGRPLYDLFGKLIYDIYGRPLTDAFGRPLIDALGQPLMDSQGNVLTSVSISPSSAVVTDVFGRRLHDRRGRALFDSYGRPRFDIFTNAIYDNCGRPATDGHGNVLFDFLNKPLQPHPEKPLYKNARAFLPKYIDRILAIPSMHRVLKYSRASLKDVFGGPLFDDLGKPLYNKIGKPLYDRYGRPLYDRDGKPLCDCYGRPLSEEIRQSQNDQTLAVTDGLKLLKLTKESSKWLEINRSQSQGLKSTYAGILDNTLVMRVVQPAKNKSTQYIYALTRVTRFSCGRQALEILEAPLSPATASVMHHLPVDNKPLIMVARRRHRIIKRRRPIKHR